MSRFIGHNKKRLFIMVVIITIAIIVDAFRISYLMIFKASYYTEKATALHERERSIKAPRGLIYDRNGKVLAGNKPVCNISVINSQITDKDKVIEVLSSYLEIDKSIISKKVNKISVREKIKSNVEKETADAIRELELDGVMVDEDYKRYYPYDDLAARVLGFTGGDNQGIVGIEVSYDKELLGVDGSINTLTTAKGIELPSSAEKRIEPINGNNLVLTLDANIPSYNLNDPFSLTEMYSEEGLDDEEKNKQLNQMWRSFSINDSYEPGSTFKIVTATAGFESGVLSITDSFYCPGYKMVEDRRIRCHKTSGHGSQTFREGIMNSCNPVFMEVGERVGVTRMYDTYEKLGLFEITGIDIPGEANSIFHKIDNVGPVELATMSFGQSFQITPLQLLRAASAIINGGTLVTPHFGKYITDINNNIVEVLKFEKEEGVISLETSDKMKGLLEAVVSEGTGKNAYIEGYRIGGKTATSEKLPRGSAKYISSFIGFAPADNPQIIGLILIDEPQGVYYGGTIAAPAIKEVFEMALPILGIEKNIITNDR